MQILHKLFLDGDDFDTSDLQEVSYNSPTCQPSVGYLDAAVTQKLLEQSSAQSIAFQGKLYLSCSDSDSPVTLPSPSQDMASASVAFASHPRSPAKFTCRA